MFAFARRSPFEWIDQAERQMNGIFGRFFEPNGLSDAAWMPACEVYSRDGKVVVRCDVPGVDPGHVHVAVRGRTLTISGERKAAEQIPEEAYWYRGIAYGGFERTVTLPEEVAATAVRATYKNGVLNIEVPIAKELTAQTVPISIEPSALAA